jgi:6,7-dimethyl-8-ribityllumazine synthase
MQEVLGGFFAIVGLGTIIAGLVMKDNVVKHDRAKRIYEAWHASEVNRRVKRAAERHTAGFAI